MCIFLDKRYENNSLSSLLVKKKRVPIIGTFKLDLE